MDVNCHASNEQNAIKFLHVRETDRQTVSVGLSVCAACMHETVCVTVCVHEREAVRDTETHRQ